MFDSFIRYIDWHNLNFLLLAYYAPVGIYSTKLTMILPLAWFEVIGIATVSVRSLHGPATSQLTLSDMILP